MPISFSEQQQCIRDFGRDNPSMPVDNIILVRLLLHVNGLYLEHRNRLLKQHGLNDTSFMALIVLYYQSERALQPSQLSEMLGLSRTNITRIADVLVANGWVERVAVEGDRRAFLLRLTAQGIHFFQELLPNQWHRLDQIFSVLKPEEHVELTHLLLKLSTRLEHLQKA
ncbi:MULTISPECIES: MarR family transcriptional regulator [Pasteurellaceae]|uniref:MarR family transcriptional regulator n=1 Tax=Pasteurellaceae TaxID=712 RepID=UPI003562B981